MKRWLAVSMVCATVAALASMAPRDHVPPLPVKAQAMTSTICSSDGGIATAGLESEAGTYNTYWVTCGDGVGPMRVAQ